MDDASIQDRIEQLVAEAQRIARIENPVIRNLEITACYARLAAGMATRAPACSNWCTYAT